MKTIILILTLGFSQFLMAQDKYTLEIENKSSTNPFGINDFYFIHHVFADAFFMTELHKQLDYDEMSDILSSVQNGVTLNDKVTLRVPQADGPDAKLVFMAKDHDKNGKTLIMLTNFNKSTRKFQEFDDKESLVRWYFIRNGKLVYRLDEFSKSEERKRKSQEPHVLIDYYLFDDNEENDSEVKALIDDLLANDESQIEQLYGRLYLGEYYLINGDLEKAEDTIEDLTRYFEEQKSIPRQYSLIVDMATTEFELVKRKNN